MFEKFFGACTITLGLYLCLALSNVLPPSSRTVMFQLSQIEAFSVPSLQESLKFENFSSINSRKKLNSRVIAY